MGDDPSRLVEAAARLYGGHAGILSAMETPALSKPPLILASGSPRRRELIAAFGLPVSVVVPNVDEVFEPGADPASVVVELAVRKATPVALSHPAALVIGADTIVVRAGEVLGKPEDRADAERMLRLLRGREHCVHTGVAVVGPDHAPLTAVMTTVVLMRDFSDEELTAYLATGESLDKAGAYGIQGAAGDIVAEVAGCYTNVVGLPLCAIGRLLREAGMSIPADPPRCGFRSDRRCPWWPQRSDEQGAAR
jgi:septum formation protein